MDRTTQAIYDRCIHNNKLKAKLSIILESKNKKRNKLSKDEMGALERILNETLNNFEYNNNLEDFERRVKSEALKVSCGTFYIRYHNSLLMYRNFLRLSFEMTLQLQINCESHKLYKEFVQKNFHDANNGKFIESANINNH
jgi:chromosome condensin MukBEF MukE localization factor